MIYCNWVKANVEEADLGRYCHDHIDEDGCNFCQPSPQLELGAKPADLLRNLKGCT